MTISTILLTAALAIVLSNDAGCWGKHMVVFGDSISDNGVRASSSTPDIHGHMRWSNGPVWADYLADDLLIAKSKQQNFAYAGARSGYGNSAGLTWSGVRWQVDQYLNNTPPAEVLNRTLVVFQASAPNDFISKLYNAKVIAGNAASALRKLVEAGLRRFLVINVGDAAATPIVKLQYPGAEFLVTFLTTGVNKLINASIANLKAEYPDLKIVLFNAQAFGNALIKSGRFKDEMLPDHNNKTAVSNAVPGDHVNYAWFDLVHPTTHVHKVLAEAVLKTLKNNKFVLNN